MYEKRRRAVLAVLAVLAVGCGGDRVAEPEDDPPEIDEWSWELLPAMPHLVLGPAAAAIGHEIFVIGGGEFEAGHPVGYVQVLDTRSMTWRRGPNLPYQSTYGAAVTVDGRLHYMGGRYSGSHLADHWVYDPADSSWAEATPLPEPVSGAVVTRIDRRVYLIGGYTAGSLHSAATRIFDVDSETWSSGRQLPGPRADWAGAAVGRRIYGAGGHIPPDHQRIEDVLVYDTDRDHWTRVTPSLPDVRSSHGAVAVGVDFCVIGASGNVGDRCYLPSLRIWSRLPDMDRDRHQVTALVLDGYIYSIGGDSWPSPPTDAVRLLIR